MTQGHGPYPSTPHVTHQSQEGERGADDEGEVRLQLQRLRRVEALTGLDCVGEGPHDEEHGGHDGLRPVQLDLRGEGEGGEGGGGGRGAGEKGVEEGDRGMVSALKGSSKGDAP